MDNDNIPELVLLLQQVGDDHLIIGHRLSELCGHGPILEEDIALSNLALDHVGAGEAFLQMSAEWEGKGKSADDLAYFRESIQFQNHQLVEYPNRDFAYTILREYLFSVYCQIYYPELKKIQHPLLEGSQFRGLLDKTLGAMTYHLRHCQDWLVRLALGTEVSKTKVQKAVNELYPYILDLFYPRKYECLLLEKVDKDLKAKLFSIYENKINTFLEELHLTRPTLEMKSYRFKSPFSLHSEYLGPLLAEMQIVARSYPGAKW